MMSARNSQRLSDTGLVGYRIVFSQHPALNEPCLSLFLHMFCHVVSICIMFNLMHHASESQLTI